MKTKIIKSLFVAIVSLLGAKTVYGQTSILLTNDGTASTLAPNQVISMTVAPETNVKVTIDIKNTSNSTKSYVAKRYDMLLNADGTNTAQAYFCIAGTCYGPPTMVSPTALVLSPMQSASDLQGPYQMLVADLDEVSIAGYSYVKYTFQNENDAADSVQIAIKYNQSVVTDISSHSKSSIKMQISPVPAKEFVTIKASELVTDADVILVDAFGKTVYHQTISKDLVEGGFKIDLTGQVSGIYFLVMTNKDKRVTRKIILE